jgi:mannose-6-phosphate isomerase-like protein (cupin superfamily)
VTAAPPLHRRPGTLTAHRISPGDTVKLAVLTGPADGSAATVVFEVWEPGGAQPPNSHAASAETFVVLAGRGRAHCDGHVRELAAGDVLVLPAGSEHRIVNSSATDRLYTLTVMADDTGEGFARLIEAGPEAELDDADLAVLQGAPR